MNSLYKFRRIGAVERWLLLESAVVLSVYRVALWLLPFRSLCRGMAPRVVPERSRAELSRLVWAVNVCSSRIPRCTCLVRALAGQFLFARHGYCCTLRIGVSRIAGGLDAHAWLEVPDSVVLGGVALERFTPLFALEQPDAVATRS